MREYTKKALANSVREFIYAYKHRNYKYRRRNYRELAHLLYRQMLANDELSERRDLEFLISACKMFKGKLCEVDYMAMAYVVCTADTIRYVGVSETELERMSFPVRLVEGLGLSYGSKVSDSKSANSSLQEGHRETE